jgi:hypothetical protein
MRKSIALLSVLLFLTLIISILFTLFKLISKKQEQFFEYQIGENSLIIKNIQSTLKKLDLNSSDAVKLLCNNFPPISTKDGEFIIHLNIKPISGKLDINNYLKDGNISREFDQIFLKIAQNYNIADPMFLKSLILDTLDKDTTERSGYSEISLQNPDFQNGKIYTYDQLKTILDYYYKQTKDSNIYKIPWKKFFYEGDGEKTFCDFLPLELKKILNITDCNEINSSIILPKYRGENSFFVKISASYVMYNKESNLSILYDVKEKKIKLIK